MRLMRYSYAMEYTPGQGSSIRVADALSRAQIDNRDELDEELGEEVAAHVEYVMAQIPATAGKMAIVLNEQKKDVTCVELAKYCHDGWPERLRYRHALFCTGQYAKNSMFKMVSCCEIVV